MSLPALLERQARAEAPRDVSLVFLFLHGGLSTIDTFDLKPDAPREFRGEFRPIDTIVPGIQVCEHLPKLAGQMDKFSLIRSFRHPDSNHGSADHYMLTGYPTAAGFNPNLRPNNQRPALGSVIARQLGPRGSVPPLRLPAQAASEHRPGVPRRDRRAVRHRRRPQRAGVHRARHRPAAGLSPPVGSTTASGS